MRECEIFHVEEAGVRGWKWRSLEPADKGRASEEVYELFYECVTAARREGFTPVPALKCA